MGPFLSDEPDLPYLVPPEAGQHSRSHAREVQCISLKEAWAVGPLPRDGNAGRAARDIAVPDTAEFFREMGDGGRLTPVAAGEAQRGDVVVLPDRRAGEYLGEGRMLVDGGEWADFLRLLPTQVVDRIDAPAASMDPLELYVRPE